MNLVTTNSQVSVFETNIRVLGGLLSAHLLADDIETGVAVHDYNGELLNLAWDLGKRLMPAFSTATGQRESIFVHIYNVIGC